MASNTSVKQTVINGGAGVSLSRSVPSGAMMVEMFILEWTFAFIMVMIDILSLILWISGH